VCILTMSSAKTGRLNKEQYTSSSSETRKSFDPLSDPGYVPYDSPEDVRDSAIDERKVDTRRHAHNGSDSPRVDVQSLNGFFEVVSAVPTHIPKGLWDSIKIYSNGGTRRLYIYVTDAAGSGAWRYTALT